MKLYWNHLTSRPFQIYGQESRFHIRIRALFSESPRKQNNPSKWNTGFTLIELIVVVAILGILMILAMPVIGTIKAQGNSATCISNLRQIGIASQQYSIDHSGFFPPLTDNEGVDWDESLKQFITGRKDSLESVFVCPVTKVRFGYNDRIGSLTSQFRRSVNIVQPARKVMIGTVERGRSIAPNVPQGGFNRMADTYGGKAILLFADGHASSHKGTDLTFSRNFDPASSH